MPYRSVIAALCLASAASAAAQGIELTPTLGLYLPAFDVIDENAPGAGQLTIAHESAIAFGARIGFAVARRVTLEGSLAHASSGVSLSASGIGTGSDDASITMLGAQALFTLSPPTRTTVFHLAAGVGLVMRGGTFWKDFEDALQAQGIDLKGTTDFGLTLGVGLRARLSPTLALRADLQDHVYPAKFTFHDTVNQVSADTQSQLQNDLRLTAGLAIALGSRTPASNSP